MIKRIVKMSFQPAKVDEFKEIYRMNWSRIRESEGCSYVELLQDHLHPNIFFTYSIWQSEEHLNQYRDSALFAGVWSATKKLFNDRPMAWSLQEQRF
jgi:quinol monooxygenase YgiN